MAGNGIDFYGDQKAYANLLSQLSVAELQAFGFLDAEGKQRRIHPRKFYKALQLAHDKIQQRKGDPTMANTETQQAAIVPAAEAPQMIMVAGDALAELAGAITTSVGAPLADKVSGELAKVNNYEVVNGPEDYVKALELRKALKGLITFEPQGDSEGRLRVQVNLVLTDAKGQKIGVATETTIGTASVADFYGPLAKLTDRLHDAITSGRGLLTDQIEDARQILERAALTWDNEQRRLKAEAEERNRKVQEQITRTDAAKHWITQLIEHGFQEATVLEILDNPLETVTDLEVETLRNLLVEKLQAEEKAKQETELASAIKQAEDMGMPEVAAELRGEATKPVVVEVPPPAPPARVMPPAPSVAQTTTPRVKGVGRRPVYDIKIVDPLLIPAEWLRPPDAKLYDPEAYPRLRAAAKGQGPQLAVPGVEVTSNSKLTQR